MKPRRPEASTEALSPEMATLLLDGPWAVGKTLHDLPPHDELRRLWARHGATLPRRRRRAWFLDRDVLVRTLRGEP